MTKRGDTFDAREEINTMRRKMNWIVHTLYAWLDLTGGSGGLNPLAHNANPPSLLEISTLGVGLFRLLTPPFSISTHFDLQMAMLKDCLRVVKDLSLYFQRDSANTVDSSNKIELAV